jgi:hypothetical protein
MVNFVLSALAIVVNDTRTALQESVTPSKKYSDLSEETSGCRSTRVVRPLGSLGIRIVLF